MEEKDFIREIEINGIKVDVDLRTCKKIDTFKIGDNVKLSIKQYDNSYRIYPGVIIDFVAFKNNPAIVVAYFEDSYGCGADLKFETITQTTEGVEIAPSLPHELELNKNRVIDKFNYDIEKKQHELDELTAKKDYFIKNFAKFFGGNNAGNEQA